MRKRFILHPFLFALFPVVSLFLNNITILTPVSLIRALVVLELIALVSWAIWWLVFRNSQAAAVTVSVLLFVFFLNRLGGDLGMPVLWAFLFVGLTIIGRRKPHWLAGISPALNAMAIIILLLQTAQYAYAFRPAASKPAPAVIASQPDPKALPHIVHIVLDGFERIDMLQKQFGCDVSFLQQHFESKGFFVATNATANYLKTMHSMGSILSMDYLPGTSATGLTHRAMLSRPQLERLVENSPARHLLSGLGYKCGGSVVSEVLLREWNSSCTTGLGLTFAEKTFLQRTIVYPFLREDADRRKGLGPWHDALLREHYNRVKAEFEDRMSELSGPAPVYRIMHIISPHPPFVFLADGRPQPLWQTDDFLFSDGDHFLHNDETWSNYREGYAEQVQYAARSACALVDRILATSTRPVAIIVQGDHGSGLDFSFESSQGNLACRSSILMAIKLPGHTPPLPDEFQSPVNLYRHLFHELWGVETSLLPKRVFYSGWTSPEVYEDVTERVAEQHRSWTSRETEEHRTVDAFLRATASTWNMTNATRWVFFDQVRHCAWDGLTLTNATVTTTEKPGEAAALNDANLGTLWTTVLKPGRTARVNVDFEKPVVLSGLRLISTERAWPGVRELKVETDQSSDVVLTNWVPSRFMWSGPSLYERDLKPYQEVFFPPQTVRRIEMELFAVADNDLIALNELECLTPGPWPEEWPEDEMMAALKQQGAKRVYAPRWLEQAIDERFKGRVSVTRPEAYRRRSACHYWKDVSSSLLPLHLTRDTVMVGYRSDLIPSEEAFRRAGVAPYSRVLGPLVLFWFDERNWREEYAYNARLFGMDGRMRYDGDKSKTKTLARFFHEQSRRPECPVPEQVEWLSRCVETYPNYQPAWLELSLLHLQAGNEPAARASRREWEERTTPATRCEASFEQGATLLGYTLATNRMTAGTGNHLICYWQIPPALQAESLAVFLRVSQGKQGFQGDQVFLDKHPAYVTRDQPFPEVFRQEMPFAAPAGLLSGPYRIDLGLYQRDAVKRLKVKSEYERRNRCIRLPTTLTIME